jgi:hypothetical protein
MNSGREGHGFSRAAQHTYFNLSFFNLSFRAQRGIWGFLKLKLKLKLSSHASLADQQSPQSERARRIAGG